MSLVELKTIPLNDSLQIDHVKKWFKDLTETGQLDMLRFPLVKVERDEEDKLIPTRAHYLKAFIGQNYYFLKIFEQRGDHVQSELINNNTLSGCKSVNLPRLHYVFLSDSYSLLLYDYIPGVTLQSYITGVVANRVGVGYDLMLDVLNQNIALARYAESHEIKRSNFSLGPAKPPLSTKLVTPEVHDEYCQIYKPFGPLKMFIEEEYPGMILDRHPRNMRVSDGKVFHVDFEIIEPSSPIFDLVKTLRGGLTKIDQERRTRNS